MSVNGAVAATLSTSSGRAQGWGSAVECAADDCGAVGAHAWTGTRIVLDSPDPAYAATLGRGPGVAGEMTTADGGTTWDVTTIEIPQFTFGG